MTQEDKELLLKDICARLPYGVKFGCKDISGVWTLTGINKLKEGFICFPGFPKLTNVVPYLRPMSSMTEEEKWDFGRIFNSFSYLKLELLENGLSFHEIYDITGRCDITWTWNELNTAIDWLLKHHFDYRGLIDMGLALPAPEGMYND